MYDSFCDSYQTSMGNSWLNAKKVTSIILAIYFNKCILGKIYSAEDCANLKS